MLLPKFFDSGFVWYSFQQTGILNPSSNSFTSFTLSLLEKVTIGTYNFVFVILNVVAVIVDRVELHSLYSSLIQDEFYNYAMASKDLQKLLKYFSETAIFMSLNTPLSAGVSYVKRLDLYLKDDEPAAVTLAGFLTAFTGDSSL